MIHGKLRRMPCYRDWKQVADSLNKRARLLPMSQSVGCVTRVRGFRVEFGVAGVEFAGLGAGR